METKNNLLIEMNTLELAKWIEEGGVEADAEELSTRMWDEMRFRELQTSIRHAAELAAQLEEFHERRRRLENLIRWLHVRRPVMRFRHAETCTCESCKICDELEPIVGLLAVKDDATVIPFERRKQNI